MIIDDERAASAGVVPAVRSTVAAPVQPALN